VGCPFTDHARTRLADSVLRGQQQKMEKLAFPVDENYFPYRKTNTRANRIFFFSALPDGLKKVGKNSRFKD
jgi:hypothetical protein